MEDFMYNTFSKLIFIMLIFIVINLGMIAFRKPYSAKNPEYQMNISTNLLMIFMFITAVFLLIGTTFFMTSLLPVENAIEYTTNNENASIIEEREISSYSMEIVKKSKITSFLFSLNQKEETYYQYTYTVKNPDGTVTNELLEFKVDENIVNIEYIADSSKAKLVKYKNNSLPVGVKKEYDKFYEANKEEIDNIIENKTPYEDESSDSEFYVFYITEDMVKGD